MRGVLCLPCKTGGVPDAANEGRVGKHRIELCNTADCITWSAKTSSELLRNRELALGTLLLLVISILEGLDQFCWRNGLDQDAVRICFKHPSDP